jgi:hypothetical protein
MKNAVLRAKIQRTIVIDPDSGFRQIWDVTQVVSHRKESYFRARPLFPSESAVQSEAVCGKMTFSSMANAKREGRQVGPEVGPTSAYYSCIPIGIHGPTRSFWANLTACSPQSSVR